MIDNIADAIPNNTSLSDAERSAVLEIGLLCIASDGRVDPDEEKAFRAIGSKLGEKKLDAIMGKLHDNLTREEADARVLELAKVFGSDATKRIAYKVAYAMSLADLSAADEEFEFDLQLVDALGLSQDTVDQLVEEVNGALAADEE